MKEGPRFTRQALAALLALAVGTPALAARHALLIGVSEYAPTGLTDLPGARQDVALMQEVLRSRLGFQRAEIRTLLDRDATHTGIECAFAELAQAVQPGDFVYIHYSGHGSRVTDFNDQGQERTGQDQTLVSFGARRADSMGLDRYDILDDELNGWLGRLADRLGESGELVVVADACHSASNTRGASALVSRAAPADSQESHPLAHGPSARHPLAGAIRIGAAGDEQSAYEYSPKADAKAGLFTWHWAAALSRAEPGETWRQTFERAELGVSLVKGTDQRPQLMGERADRPILGGGLPARPAVLVTEVRGATATLNAGRLVGVTPESLYAAREAADAAQVRILESGTTWSRGRIESGTLRVGDFVSERERAYESAPLGIYALPAQDGRDQPLAESLRARVRLLSGFVWTDSQGESDLVLAVLRPKRVAGQPQFAQTPKGRDTLPIPDPAAAPEVWVLNRGERLLHERLAVPLPPTGEGIETLARNLERYRRTTELRRLTAEAADTPVIALAVVGLDTCSGPTPECAQRRAAELRRLTAAKADQTGIDLALIRFEVCTEAAPGCSRPTDTAVWYRRIPGTVPITDLDGLGWPDGSLISFTLENIGHHGRYVYLLELSPDGAIYPVFPKAGANAETALLLPGKRLELSEKEQDAGLMLDVPGAGSILVLTTQYPIDPRFLTQAGYERGPAGARTVGPNRLERFLADAVQGSDAPIRGTFETGTWGGTLFDYRVQPRGATPTKTP